MFEHPCVLESFMLKHSCMLNFFRAQTNVLENLWVALDYFDLFISLRYNQRVAHAISKRQAGLSLVEGEGAGEGSSGRGLPTSLESGRQPTDESP